MNVSRFRLVLSGWVAVACLALTPVAFAQKNFLLDVSVITGEHSRDAGSVTRAFRVSAKTLMYEETYQGMRAGLRRPIKKEFPLTAEDRGRLIGLLKEKALVRTKSISKSPAQLGPSRYFELSIATRLAGRQGLISIKAPRSAIELKTNHLYQSSVLLIAELYRIINRTDPDIAFDDLIK